MTMPTSGYKMMSDIYNDDTLYRYYFTGKEYLGRTLPDGYSGQYEVASADTNYQWVNKIMSDIIVPESVAKPKAKIKYTILNGQLLISQYHHSPHFHRVFNLPIELNVYYNAVTSGEPMTINFFINGSTYSFATAQFEEIPPLHPLVERMVIDIMAGANTSGEF